jgi:hypothetical protein
MRPLALLLGLSACTDREQPRTADGVTDTSSPATPGMTSPAAPTDGDADDDGWQQGEDCDDSDASVHPGADDPAYDGVDANCDGADDFDVDGDGQDAAAFGGGDCGDADPARFEGAPRVCGNGVDDDCDGAFDCDIRGDLLMADVATARFTGTPVSSAGYEIQTADYDGDGALDMILAADRANVSFVFRGPLLDTRESSAASAVLPGGAGGAAFGDFTGDGVPDVATTSDDIWSPTVTTIYAGPALDDQQEAQLVHADPDVTGTVLLGSADMNSDGFDDLLIGGFSDHLLGDSYGTIAAEVLFGPLAGALTDADADAFVTADPEDPWGAGGIVLDASNDLAGDGQVDLLLSAASTTNRFFVVEQPLEPIASELDAAIQMAPGPGPACAYAWAGTTGDLDGDGYADLLTSTHASAFPCADEAAAWVFLGPLVPGDLTPADAWVTVPANVGDAAMPGDLDGDGEADLVLSNTAQLLQDPYREEQVEILYAPRGFASADAVIHPSKYGDDGKYFATPGDIDGDGLADILTSDVAIQDRAGAQCGGAWTILGQPTGF